MRATWILLALVYCVAGQYMLATQRYYFAGARLGSKFFFGGGSNGSMYLSSVEVYDESTGTWNTTATGAGSLSIARSDLAAGAAGTKLIFGGGRKYDS